MVERRIERLRAMIRTLVSLALMISTPTAAQTLLPTDAQAIPKEPKVVQLAGAYEAACVLFDNGEVWCWGSGAVGGLYSNVIMKIKMPDGLPAKTIAAGTFHGCAILSDDSLACW